MQNGFPPRKQSAGLSAMNGYGNHTAPSGSSPYAQLPATQQLKTYVQGSVQKPELSLDNGRHAPNGSISHTPPSYALLQGYSATNAANGMSGLGISGMGHSPATPRMSNQLDMADPVALHLLVETALGDSETYHVLSFDEVDRNKKELATVTPRIETARKKLALESKVRDAALSVIKLHPGGGLGARKRDSMIRAEDEVAQSEKRCADLAQELYALETQQRECQTRLLMHTAGVLQMTHRGPTEKRNLREFGHRSDVMGGTNGRPDSPESIYTYENGRTDRSNTRIGLDDFDERSLYRTPDDMSSFSFDGSSKTEQSAATEKQLAELGMRLDELNAKLREAIKQANAGQPAATLEANGTGKTTGLTSLTWQLDVVERNVGILRGAQSQQQVLPKLQHFNKQLYGLLNAAAADGYKRQETPAPPSFEVDDAASELKYMESAVTSFSSVVREMLQRAQASRDLQERDAHERGKAEQMETALEGLWMMLISNEEESRRGAKAGAQSGAVPFDQNEPFNLSAFNKKVQSLIAQSGDLRAAQDSHTQELQVSRGHADRAIALEQQLTAKTNEYALLESALQASRDTTAERQRTLQTLREQLVEKDNQVQAREAELNNARGQVDQQHTDLEAELVRLTTELTVAKAELDAAYGSRAERQKEASGREKKLEEELRSTLQEFEELTKASVDSEKERDKLEAAVDQLRERVEEAEASLSDEKTRWLGFGSPGSNEAGAVVEATSVTTMRAEFRKMIKETRLEGVKALRVSHRPALHTPLNVSFGSRDTNVYPHRLSKIRQSSLSSSFDSCARNKPVVRALA